MYIECLDVSPSVIMLVIGAGAIVAIARAYFKSEERVCKKQSKR